MGEGQDQPDERLVLLAKDGNLEAFNRLVERYQRPVYSLCYRLLGFREPAEDATQETFLSAYRSLDRFAGGNVRSWLLRIAANESKDELRRQKRKVSDSLDAMVERAGSTLELADPAAEAGNVVERLTITADWERALLGLPFDQRQALLLVDVYDFHYDEVAVMTGASLGTIKSRIHRGRERLRELVTSHPELFAGTERQEGRSP
ncbi:MAG: RNA polymerase sigma factor [Dehalococcoidia bacterium]